MELKDDLIKKELRGCFETIGIQQEQIAELKEENASLKIQYKRALYELRQIKRSSRIK